MAMRLTGLMSGMDTESMIQQLVEAKSTKVETAKKDQDQAGLEAGCLERTEYQAEKSAVQVLE